MFKYILCTVLSIAPFYTYAIQFSEDTSQPTGITEETQPLSQSIDFIIKELERGIILLDDTNIAEVQDSLYIIDTISRELLIQLIALLKIGKLDELGVTNEQLTHLATTFKAFHTKLAATLPLLTEGVDTAA